MVFDDFEKSQNEKTDDKPCLKMRKTEKTAK